MQNVIEKTVPFQLGEETFQLKATFNTEAFIEEQFGTLGNAITEERKFFANCREILTHLINESISSGTISAEEVGKRLSRKDAERVIQAILEVFELSRPAVDPDDELTDDERKN